MPFTSAKGYSTQTAGSNVGTWGAGNPGNDLNTGVMSIMDANMGGITSLSLASTATVNLTAAQCQNAMLSLTGTLTLNVTISNNSNLMVGFFYFENLTSGAFTVKISNGVGSSLLLPQSMRGVFWIDATSGPRMMSTVGSTNPSILQVTGNAITPFYNSTAPAGWTINNTLSDFGARIVNGGTTGGSANNTAGRTAYSTANTGDYTLQIADIPSHTHAFTYNNAGYQNAANNAVSGIVQSGGGVSVNTQSTGGGGAHRHAATSNIQTADFVLAQYTG